MPRTALKSQPVNLSADGAKIVKFTPQSPLIQQLINASGGSTFRNNDPEFPMKVQAADVFMSEIRDNGLPMAIILDGCSRHASYQSTEYLANRLCQFMLTIAEQLEQERLTHTQALALIRKSYRTVDNEMRLRAEFDVVFGAVICYQAAPGCIRALCFATGDAVVCLDDGQRVATVLAARAQIQAEGEKDTPLPFPTPQGMDHLLELTYANLEIADIEILPNQRFIFMTDGAWAHLPCECTILQEANTQIRRIELTADAIEVGQNAQTITENVNQHIRQTFTRRSKYEILHIGDDLMTAEMVIPNAMQRVKLSLWVQTQAQQEAIAAAYNTLVNNNDPSAFTALDPSCQAVLLSELTAQDRSRVDLQQFMITHLSNMRSLNCLDLQGFTQLSDNDLSQILSNSRGQLQALDVTGCGKLTNTITENISNCQQLRALSLANTTLTEIQTSWRSKPRNFPQLVMLNISNTPIKIIKINAPYLSQFYATNCPRLSTFEIVTNQKVLDLGNNEWLTEKGLTELTSRLPQTSRLYLTGCRRINYPRLRGFVQYWPRLSHFLNPETNQLDLTQSMIDDDLLISLTTIFYHQSNVREVNLGHNLITSRGIAQFIKSLPSDVSWLNLSDNDLSDSSFSLICAALERNYTLEDLHLSRCQLSENSLIILANMLKNNYTLKRLTLTGNEMTENVVQAFLETLTENHTLILLNLGIESDQRVSAIRDAIVRNQQWEVSAQALNRGIRCCKALGVGEDFDSARIHFQAVNDSGLATLITKAAHFQHIIQQTALKRVELSRSATLLKKARTLNQLSRGSEVNIELVKLVFHDIALCYAQSRVGLYALNPEDPLSSTQLTITELDNGLTITSVSDDIILANIDRARQIPQERYYLLMLDSLAEANNLCQSLLDNITLSTPERCTVIERQKRAVNEEFRTQQQYFLTEMVNTDAFYRSNIARRSIEQLNHFINVWSEILLPQNQTIDVSKVNLRQVDLSGLDLSKIIFETSANFTIANNDLEGVNLSDTVIRAEQLAFVYNIDKIQGLDPNVSTQIEALISTTLGQFVDKMKGDLERGQRLVQAVENMSKLICNGNAPDLSMLDYDNIKLLGYWSFRAYYLNQLPHRDVFSHANVGDKNEDYMDQFSLEDIREGLIKMLQARHYKLPAETVVYAQSRRLATIRESLSFDISMNDSLIYCGYLSQPNQSLFEDKIHKLKRESKVQRAGISQSINEKNQLFINAALDNLYGEPDPFTHQDTNDRLRDALSIAENSNLVVDFTTIDLTRIDLSQFDFKDCIVLFTPKQMALLTEDQQNACCHRIFTAARSLDIEAVSRILNKGFNINNADSDGQTVLMEVCRLIPSKKQPASSAAFVTRLIELVELLLDRGANINQGDKRQRTALMTACYNLDDAVSGGAATFNSAKLALVQYLLDRGADVNLLTVEDKTPFGDVIPGWRIIESICLIGPVAPPELITMLESAGAEVDFTSAVYLGDVTRLNKITAGLDNEAVQQLTGVVDRKNEYPLHVAVARDHYNATCWLLDIGANIEITNRCGQTALHIAVSLGLVRITELLLRKTAQVNVYDKDGNSVLLTAVKAGFYELAELLIANDAEIDCYSAIALNRKDDIRALISGRYNQPVEGINTALGTAAHWGYLEVVEWLCDPEQGADPNVAGFKRYVPLSAAIRGGHLEVVRALIRAGADTNIFVNNKPPPLMEAVIHGDLDIVDCLLTYPKEVNQPPVDIECVFNERTPLLQVVQENNIPVARLLLRHGANHQVTNASGNPLLHIAAENGSFEMIQLLIAAMTLTPNRQGNSPLAIAQARNATAAVKFLQNLNRQLQDQPNQAESDVDIEEDLLTPPISASMLEMAGVATGADSAAGPATRAESAAESSSKQQAQAPDTGLPSLAGFFSPLTHPQQQFHLYQDNDINTIVNIAVRHRLGGYVHQSDGMECSFLLQGLGTRNDFPGDVDENIRYIVATTPAVDASGQASPLTYYLDRTTQEPPDEGKPDHRADVFDELMPRILDTRECYIKILFPYNLTADFHWVTGEIKIHKNNHEYRVVMMAHNPYGRGEITTENCALIAEALRKRLTDYDESAQIVECNSLPSFYVGRRQARGDGQSCGVIVAEELIKRITGASLDLNEPYPHGAEILRIQHVEHVIKFLGEDDPTCRNFLQRNEAVLTEEQKELLSQASNRQINNTQQHAEVQM